MFIWHQESLLFIADELFKPSMLQPFDEWFTVQLPLSYLKYDTTRSDHVRAMQQIRKHYFGNDPIDENHLPEYIDLLSDIAFEYPIHKAVRNQLERSSGKTYMHE